MNQPNWRDVLESAIQSLLSIESTALQIGAYGGIQQTEIALTARATMKELRSILSASTPSPELTDQQLVEMQDRCDAASKGPWGYDLNHTIAQVVDDDEEWGPSVLQLVPNHGKVTEQMKDDGQFAALARTDLPRLIDAYRELRDRK